MKGPGKRRDKGRQKGAGSEWVGGRVLAPFYVTEGGPFRPELILWLEMPEELILNGTIVDPRSPEVSFAEALARAMEAPLVGPPRRPGRIRVEDRRLAEEIGGAARGIEVVVAPTPEVDRVLRHMAESFPARGEEEPSYFEDGRVSAETLGAFFRSAEVLFRLAPWKLGADLYPLRVDIPRLGVEGQCVSVIGSLGESLGFLLFPSLEAHDCFISATESMSAGPSPGGAVDLGTPMLSLLFERGADLPARMRKEVSENGWPVAGPDAYPRVRITGQDGMLAPLRDTDVRIVSACARSLGAFFAKHGRLFESEDLDPVCESYFDGDDLEVRFTVPYEAGPFFEVNAPRGPGPMPAKPEAEVARNAPCPCGSGKKYKRCCLGKKEGAEGTDAEQPASASPDSRGAPLHRLDGQLVDAMMRFSAQSFGRALLQAQEDFFDPQEASQLLVPWSVYHFLIEGKPLVQWFLEEKGSRLSASSRAWLEAQQASWLSVWEVTEADPGSGRLSLKDLLSEEERTVEDVIASQTLVARDVVLGRVVDHGGMSVICGIYPAKLPPLEGAEVVQEVRRRLRRRRAVPLERLRDEKIGRYMIQAWEDAVDELRLRMDVPPSLQNTDGDALLLTVDHFSFDPEAHREVEARLAAIEGVEPPSRDDSDRVFTFVRAGSPAERGLSDTITGTVRLSDGRLRLETNSVRRADRLRARIEEACGGLVRHRTREHSDPAALLKEAAPRRRKGAQPELLSPDEAAGLVREFKKRHYAGWLDTPIPALGDRTPREAVRTREGKYSVDVLLKDMENQEHRLPEGDRFGFSGIRRELGLDP
jgi:hypothetical protein